MKKAFFVVLLLVVLGSGAFLGGAWLQYQAFVKAPLAIPAGGAVFDLQPGSSGRRIVSELAERGLTRDDWRWKLLMRFKQAVYRAGEYRLEPGLTPPELLELLASGDVIHYRFTLVEGWSFRQLAAALAADPVLEHELPYGEGQEQAVLELFPGMDHPEGWFLPETYQFIRGDSDVEILTRAHEAMEQALMGAWESRLTGLPLQSPYELLILASIIEKETALESERGQIAGVFVRRLSRGMRLQTDPTVIYGLGESFDGDIRRRDLRTDTPYNTYTRHGLPPTPIAMPGRASLQAAAHPEPGETLYFVADGKGGHTFSRTLAEHQAAVDRLIGRN